MFSVFRNKGKKMTHTFKRAVLFAAVVSMGAASAVSTPKFVARAKDAISAKAQKFDAWQRRVLASKASNYVLGALLVAKVGVANSNVVLAAASNPLSWKSQVSKKAAGKAFKRSLMALTPVDAVPLTYKSGFKLRAIPAIPQEFHLATDVKTPAELYTADDARADASHAEGSVKTPAVYYKVTDIKTPGKAGIPSQWSFATRSKFTGRGFAKGLNTAVIYTISGLKAFNAIRDAQAKRAAAKAAKPAQA
jgi:hypothetical protein